jgi:hypothetical protein
MRQYGIRMIIFTTQRELEELAEDFHSMPMSRVRNVHKRSLSNAREAENYFERYPERATIEKSRYSDFCNDCAIATISGNIGFSKPVHLVHPSALENIDWDPKFDSYRKEAGNLKIDLDDSIPLVQ